MAFCLNPALIYRFRRVEFFKLLECQNERFYKHAFTYTFKEEGVKKGRLKRKRRWETKNFPREKSSV